MRIVFIFFIKIFQYFIGAIIWKLFNGSSRKKRRFYPKQIKRLPKNDGIIRFSFGKYKGEPVEKIWNTNRQYIDWLRENGILHRYPDEEFMIDLLVHENF